MDYNATTPLEEEVLSAIHDALGKAWANPASCHPAGRSRHNTVTPGGHY